MPKAPARVFLSASRPYGVYRETQQTISAYGGASRTPPPTVSPTLLLYDLTVQIATTVVRDGLAMTPKGCGVYLICDLIVEIATTGVRDGLAMTLNYCGAH